MMTPRIMAFRQPRPRGARTRRAALACRVEALEPRFLLTGTDVASQTDSDQLATISLVERASPHATEATAQALPLDMNVNVAGALTADGPPAVFRVPLDAANFPKLAIGMSWTGSRVSVAGRVRIVDNLGRMLVDQALSNRPATVELPLEPQEAAADTLFIEIVPMVGRAPSARFLLNVQPQAAFSFAPDNTSVNAGLADGSSSWTFSAPAPEGQTIPSGATSINTAPVSGNTASSPGSTSMPSSPSSGAATGPSLGPIGGTPAPRSTVSSPLPLPQSSAQPAAGIFVTADMPDAAAHEVAAVLADLSFLGVAPGRSNVTALVVSPSASAGPTLGSAAAPESELWVGPGSGRGENGAAVLGYDLAEPPSVVFGLPPSGVLALAQSRTDPASAWRASARPALPRLVDEAVPDRCPDVVPVRRSAAVEPTNGRRPRAVAAILYGAFCAMIGAVAPEWTQILRRPVHGLRRRGPERFLVG